MEAPTIAAASLAAPAGPSGSKASALGSSAKKRPQLPPPDLTERFKLKAKYAKLQLRYLAATQLNGDLQQQLQRKTHKNERLQDEVDLIIDQIYDSDYRHLAPLEPNYFSDDDDLGHDDDDDARPVETDATRLARQLEYGIEAKEANGRVKVKEKQKEKEKEKDTDKDKGKQVDSKDDGEEEDSEEDDEMQDCKHVLAHATTTGISRTRDDRSLSSSSSVGNHKRARIS